MLFQTGSHARVADAEWIGLEINRRIKIDTAENHPAIHLRRTQDERNLGAGVQPHAGGLDDGFQCALAQHGFTKWLIGGLIGNDSRNYTGGQRQTKHGE